MKVANIAGRLSLVDERGGLDVERASAGRFGSAPQEIYQHWQEFVDWAPTVQEARRTPFEEDDLGAPVPAPRQIFAVGLNYAEHAAEAAVENPTFPPVFTKFQASIAGPRATIELPTETVDWEAELVVVISRDAYRVAAGHALSHVAGVTVGQDVSERTSQLRPPMPQFSLGKSFPGFAPIGPAVVTVDELSTLDDLRIECRVNDEVVQQGSTADMIFDVAAIIERLSSVTKLYAGDIIFTGTPSGVGVARSPQWFLKPDDVLTTTIEGVGMLRNRFIAPGTGAH